MKNKLLAAGILILVFIGGFVTGMEYEVYQVRSSLDLVSKSLQDQPIQSPETTKSPIIKYTDKKVGEIIELSTLKFQVSGSEETKTISGGSGSPRAAREGSKFVIISINITNTTKSKFTLFPDDGFRLIDSKDREYQIYSETIGAIDNYLDVRDLSPDIEEKGVIVYEIPNDAENYALVAYKAGSNEAFRIKLK